MADHSKTANACKDREENLVLFHYGDLAENERQALGHHLTNCAGCTGFLAELSTFLPLTVKTDEPPENFWRDYNRALRHKIEAASEKTSWREILAGLFRPRLLPAWGAAAAITLALALTFGDKIRQSNDPPREETALIEALPVAENLEFFKSMEVLDNLDLLESMGNAGDAA